MTNLSFSVSPTEWAAFVAIDWADQKHCWALTPSACEEVERGELDASPQAVETWAAELNVRFSGRPIAVCLEQKRGALVYMLAKYAHLVIFPMHPRTAAQYRETFCPSGAKSDPADAAWLLDLLLRHRHQLRELRPDTPETRLLQHLTEYRRRLVDEATRQKNRLTSCLKSIFRNCWAGLTTSGPPWRVRCWKDGLLCRNCSGLIRGRCAAFFTSTTAGVRSVSRSASPPCHRGACDSGFGGCGSRVAPSPQPGRVADDAA